MAGNEDYKIFVGGLAYDVSERQLERTFSPYGKIIETQSTARGYVPVICGLSRCNERDIKDAWEAVKYAKRPRIHTFIATSDIHLEFKLQKSKQEVIELARSMVRYARSLGCDDVEFSPEDAGRFGI